MCVLNATSTIELLVFHVFFRFASISVSFDVAWLGDTTNFAAMFKQPTSPTEQDMRVHVQATHIRQQKVRLLNTFRLRNWCLSTRLDPHAGMGGQWYGIDPPICRTKSKVTPLPPQRSDWYKTDWQTNVAGQKAKDVYGHCYYNPFVDIRIGCNRL